MNPYISKVWVVREVKGRKKVLGAYLETHLNETAVRAKHTYEPNAFTVELKSDISRAERLIVEDCLPSFKVTAVKSKEILK